MSNSPHTIGFIVARGGGSTLYRKNAYRIHGRPVLHRAIDILQKSGVIDEVLVWTEDVELKEITIEAGGIPLDRPRDMVHYFNGVNTLGEWHYNQVEQIKDAVGDYQYIASFNCNTITFRPESLRAMHEKLVASPSEVFRVQAVCQIPGGLCLENAENNRLIPLWNDTEKSYEQSPPLYRMLGVTIATSDGAPDVGNPQTLYHEVSMAESFDFQHADDIPFAQYRFASEADQG